MSGQQDTRPPVFPAPPFPSEPPPAPPVRCSVQLPGPRCSPGPHPYARCPPSWKRSCRCLTSHPGRPAKPLPGRPAAPAPPSPSGCPHAPCTPRRGGECRRAAVPAATSGTCPAPPTSSHTVYCSVPCQPFYQSSCLRNFTHLVFIWRGYCPLSLGLRRPVHSKPPAGPSQTKPEAFREVPHSLSRI